MPRYDFASIEPKWQAHWREHQTFRAQFDPTRPKLYVLDMFPYPSGDGLHVGHPEGYTATDIVSRYARMCGKNVLHPMGWDAFGLPAEQYAIQTGTHPAITTRKNVNRFREQLQSLGFSYDWDREVSTTDPRYVRWTQWIFLQLFDTWYDADCRWTAGDGVTRTGRGRPITELPIPAEVQQQGADAVREYQDRHRLAYISHAPVNWCPALGTVLANEEVTSDGKSERGNHPVERRSLRQWMLRITAYAERLLSELDAVDWPESVKLLQRNWIGRSVGAEIDFLAVDASAVSAGAETMRPQLSPLGEQQVATWRARAKSTGFPASAPEGSLRVYTTRPDTLYGATYVVLAPEHPLVDQVTSDAQRTEIEAYRQRAALKSDLDRTDLAKEKTGVFTGGYAVNPINSTPIPIWIADYVLASYGTGAIMAVPGHDTRDLEFARTFDLPVIPVVSDPQLAAQGQPPEASIGFTGEGTAINSGEFDGLPTATVKASLTERLASEGFGREAVNYRLRDWLFSRQRYWGEPFPIWHELDAQGEPTGKVRPVDASELPVELPEMEDFQPTGTPDPLLSKAPADWLYRMLPDGTRLKRETNSMPQWAGSCWYYLRFADPENDERFIDPAIEKYWLPVDLYIGGAEHAVLHLLYSRFWHKVLFDRGHVSHAEPFGKLVNQGMILGEMEFTAFHGAGAPTSWVSARSVDIDRLQTSAGQTVEARKLTADQVEKRGDSFVLKEQPEIAVDARSFKMSKSRRNVINPDTVVKDYGADSLRLYEMFMGPLEATKPWSMAGVDGVHRFLSRVWRLFVDEHAETPVLAPWVQPVDPSPEQLRTLHRTIKFVTKDIDELSFNTAISRMMEFVNELTGAEVRPRAVLQPFVLLLSPFAPHLAEELWSLLGHTQSLAYEPWPQFDPALLETSDVELPVQVNGKVRSKVVVAKSADQAAVTEAATADATIAQYLSGKTIVKVVYVPGRLLNFVIKP